MESGGWRVDSIIVRSPVELGGISKRMARGRCDVFLYTVPRKKVFTLIPIRSLLLSALLSLYLITTCLPLRCSFEFINLPKRNQRLVEI